MTETRGAATRAEVNWPLDDTTMYATLVRPAGNGPFPCVVMVAGSGPTDRDWTSPLLPGSNGSARLLAGALAETGFASLRYDKRAAGPHAAENFPKLMGKVSMQTHADELASAVGFLHEQDFCDLSRVFVLTNSEGALHGLNYQVRDTVDVREPRFAGMVLTAPPGRVMGQVGRAQVVAQLSVVPGGEKMIAAYDAAIRQFQAGEAVTVDPILPEGVVMLLQSLSAPMNLPFARELWLADAAAMLPKVTAPVLVVIGQKDIQVDWQADGAALQAAVAGKDNVEFVFPENANHVLKHEPRPRAELNPAEVGARYNADGEDLDSEALGDILRWFGKHA